MLCHATKLLIFICILANASENKTSCWNSKKKKNILPPDYHELENMKKLLKEETSIDEKTQEFKEKSQQLKEVKEELADKTEQLKEKSLKLNEVNKNLAERLQQIDEKTREFNKITEELEERKNQSDSKQLAVEKIVLEFDALEFKKNQLNAKINEKKNEEKELSRKKNQSDKLDKQLEEKTQRLNKVNDELEMTATLANKIEMLKNVSDELEVNHSLKKKTEQLKEKSMQLEEKTERLNKVNDELEITATLANKIEMLKNVSDELEVIHSLKNKTEQLKEKSLQLEEVDKQLAQQKSKITSFCAICQDDAKPYKWSRCGHEFCGNCAEEWKKRSNACPTCRCKDEKTHSHQREYSPHFRYENSPRMQHHTSNEHHPAWNGRGLERPLRTNQNVNHRRIDNILNPAESQIVPHQIIVPQIEYFYEKRGTNACVGDFYLEEHLSLYDCKQKAISGSKIAYAWAETGYYYKTGTTGRCLLYSRVEQNEYHDWDWDWSCYVRTNQRRLF